MNIDQTDKYYWHRYTDTYRVCFDRAKARGPVATIVEWGVLNGDSIAWLRSIFPEARIHGLDIVAEKAEWPKDAKITYHQVDQGDFNAIQAFYRSIKSPDLIIEDGSHVTKHQSDCLRAGFRALRGGGTYILEDIHTAYCAIIDRTRLLRHRVLGRFGLRLPGKLSLNSLSLLLGLENYRERGGASPADLADLGRDSDFTVEDVEYLNEMIATFFLFRRTQLPLACWRCKKSDYALRSLKCRCGADVFGTADSMSYILTKK